MVTMKQRFDPDDHYDGTNHVEYIVMHDTGNKTDSDEGNANYFVTGTRKASAHYFVDDDSITQVVKDSDGAFHCGDGHGQYGITNNNSLSIEMCRRNGTVTEQTEANALGLVFAKMKEYNVPIEKVVRHYDASRKPCPGSFMANHWARWTSFKLKLAAMINPNIQKPQAAQAPTVTKVESSGTVTASKLNVRDGAGTNFPVLGQLDHGTKVRIGAKVPGWYNIYYGDHGGWVSKDYIQLDNAPAATPAPVAKPAFPKYGVVTASSLNVRDGAGTNYKRLGGLGHGTKVKIGSESGNWWNIYYGDHGGWVSKDYISFI